MPSFTNILGAPFTRMRSLSSYSSLENEPDQRPITNSNQVSIQFHEDEGESIDIGIAAMRYLHHKHLQRSQRLSAGQHAAVASLSASVAAVSGAAAVYLPPLVAAAALGTGVLVNEMDQAATDNHQAATHRAIKGILKQALRENLSTQAMHRVQQLKYTKNGLEDLCTILEGDGYQSHAVRDEIENAFETPVTNLNAETRG